MAQTLEALTPELVEWIDRQPMFFVASAPAGPDGHVNLSPKGHDSIRVLDPTTVAYLDLTGSAAETVAHVRENGRLTIMFCAFEGPPRILRLFGRAEVVLPGDDDWDHLRGRFGDLPGVRSVLRSRLDRIATSCGFSVPRLDLVGERDTLLTWAERKGPDELEAYRAKNNRTSIDGLPGLP